MFTQEEEKKFNDFIVKAIIKNAAIPHSARIGTVSNYSVQELVHMNVASLRGIGIQIETAVEKHGGSRFKKDSRLEIPAGSGIAGDEWLEFLEICISRNEKIEEDKAKTTKIKELRRRLEGMKSESEIKSDLQKELDALEGKVPEVQVA